MQWRISHPILVSQEVEAVAETVAAMAEVMVAKRRTTVMQGKMDQNRKRMRHVHR